MEENKMEEDKVSIFVEISNSNGLRIIKPVECDNNHIAICNAMDEVTRLIPKVWKELQTCDRTVS